MGRAGQRPGHARCRRQLNALTGMPKHRPKARTMAPTPVARHCPTATRDRKPGTGRGTGMCHRPPARRSVLYRQHKRARHDLHPVRTGTPKQATARIRRNPGMPARQPANQRPSGTCILTSIAGRRRRQKLLRYRLMPLSPAQTAHRGSVAPDCALDRTSAGHPRLWTGRSRPGSCPALRRNRR